MSVKKDELYKLIDRLDPLDHEIIYVLLQRFAADWRIEADHSPLTDEEKNEIEKALRAVKRGEVVDWKDIKRENHL